MAPLDQPVLHDKAHRVAQQLVSAFAARDPDRYILSAQAKRRGRIFLDYLRNGRGTTAIGDLFAASPRGISDRSARDLEAHRERDRA